MCTLINYVDAFEENFYPSQVVMIEGIPVETLESLLRWKVSRGRPKDLADAELIRKVMKSKQGTK
jgi:hypothetical protein